MLYAFLFYWMVCALASYMISHDDFEGKYPSIEVVICFILGGIIIPARLIVKAVR